MCFGGSSSSGILLQVLAILTVGIPVLVAGKRKQKEVKLAMKAES